MVIGAPERRLQLATEFGVAAVISVEDVTDVAARRERVAAEVRPYGANVVIECVGRPQAVPEGWELCRDGGKYLVLGQYADAGEVMVNPHTITRKQLQIFGQLGIRTTARRPGADAAGEFPLATAIRLARSLTAMVWPKPAKL